MAELLFGWLCRGQLNEVVRGTEITNFCVRHHSVLQESFVWNVL